MKEMEEIEESLSKMRKLERDMCKRAMLHRYFIKNPVKIEKIIPFKIISEVVT